jgi:rRNA processing protein Gar1
MPLYHIFNITNRRAVILTGLFQVSKRCFYFRSTVTFQTEKTIGYEFF